MQQSTHELLHSQRCSYGWNLFAVVIKSHQFSNKSINSNKSTQRGLLDLFLRSFVFSQ